MIELKNRRAKDVMLVCTGDIKETISTAFPSTEYQRRIIRQVRNTTLSAFFRFLQGQEGFLCRFKEI